MNFLMLGLNYRHINSIMGTEPRCLPGTVFDEQNVPPWCNRLRKGTKKWARQPILMVIHNPNVSDAKRNLCRTFLG